MRSCWTMHSTENPIILETEPDQEFLGFMLETKPLELIYQGPTNVSQVLSPFSASPPKVLLSGFRSRCHIVIKGAFPDSRVQQGLDQLIHVYTRAGFPKEELHAISRHILTQHQNLQPPMKNLCCPNCSIHSSSALLIRLVFFLPFLSFLSLGCDCSFPPQLSFFLLYSLLCYLATWLKLGNLSLLSGVSPHGPCSRSCLSSPPGSGLLCI